MALSGAARGVLAALLTLVVVAGGVVGYAAWLLSGVPGRGDEVIIEVPSGATAASVAHQLDGAGVIRSARAFQLKARSRNLDRRLQAGRYELEAGMSVDEAIERLLADPKAPEAIRFTVPEGLTVAETLDRLAQQTPHRVDDYRQVLEEGRLHVPDWVPDLKGRGVPVPARYEGLLFPETYEVRRDAPPEAILQRMVDQLTSVYGTVPTPLVARATREALNPYKVLILASLVEEEARIPGERPAIAGVIMNRLRARMALQIDASNLYAAGEK